jgi:FKBP-type peptidyl-prolyl cis-trans isomerase
MTSGIKIVAENEGTGARAEKGDLVAFECAAFLSKGSEVHPRRSESVVLGSRRFIAGVETALVAMREGGYRKVRISPHLAYRASGVEGKVPANAVLIYELWLTSVQKRGLTPKSRGTRAKAARAPHLER